MSSIISADQITNLYIKSTCDSSSFWGGCHHVCKITLNDGRFLYSGGIRAEYLCALIRESNESVIDWKKWDSLDSLKTHFYEQFKEGSSLSAATILSDRFAVVTEGSNPTA